MLQPLWVHADGVEILARPRDFPSVIEGLFVGPDGLNGWEDGGGDVRRESVERPASIGEFDLPVYEGPLVFSMEGHALAQSEQQLAVLRDRVTGVGYGGRRFKVAVGLQGRELWTWVRRGSKADVSGHRAAGQTSAGIVHAAVRRTDPTSIRARASGTSRRSSGEPWQ